MALKKPLVITSGQIQQLQSGDYLDPATVPPVVSLTNGNAGSVVICRAVYSDAAGSFDLAQADAAATSLVIGLVFDSSINAAAAGLVQTHGVFVATTGQWDVVTGGSGGLTAGSEYYLSAATAGALTTTAPSTATQLVCPLGVALSTTQLRLGIKTTILLA